MKQLLQHIRTGQAAIVDVPAPQVEPGKVLVRTAASLVSAGTERMVVNFAGKNLLQKARARPDLVRQAIGKAQRDGVLTMLEAIQNRLDQPLALGYSCAGTALGIGSGISEFQVGDRVACAGGGYAVHAEAVSVPRNLAVKLPENVDFEAAAFTTVGAIALQGIRLAEVKLGEIVAVIGLGLLGQLTVQMLKAAGCVVAGLDIQPQRADLARQLGADEVTTEPDTFLSIVQRLSSGHGADAVLITADTPSNQPIELAGEVVRGKGIVVAVGSVGMTIPRKIYYEKELDFRISRSYGPGRYDADYEEKGRDYPYAYIRWTERRNMQAFVQLLAEGKVDLQPLITHRFPIQRATEAYQLITGKTGTHFLGVLLTYPDRSNLSRKIVLRREGQISSANDQPANIEGVSLGLLGAGNFATATLLPAIKRMTNIDLVGVCSVGGLSAHHLGHKFGFAYCTTDETKLLDDPAINTVAIVTRHHLHARQVTASLEAGKHVFVEKPLCLSLEELQTITTTYQAGREHGEGIDSSLSAPYLMVGFNRRFAPFIIELKQSLQSVREPLMLHYRVNAGFIPPDHWVQDPAQGGGRLLGEVCHFIDLLIYLAADVPQRVTTRALPDEGRYSKDNLLITIEFANGSVGSITYVANGDAGFGKECLEVFGGGLSARLEDYRTLVIRYGSKRVKRVAWLRQDKGHRAEWQALAAYLTGRGPVPISFAEVVCSTQATLAAQCSLQQNEPVFLNEM